MSDNPEKHFNIIGFILYFLIGGYVGLKFFGLWGLAVVVLMYFWPIHVAVGLLLLLMVMVAVFGWDLDHFRQVIP